jgi:hypothetical protein
LTTEYTLTATNRCDSAEDSVTVTVEAAPDAPALVSPADGSTALAVPVTLSWNAVAGVTDYTVELATDAGFTQIVQSPTVAATSVNMSSLTGSATYHWRVIANGTCLSAPSTARSFTVETSLFSDGFESGNTAAWSLALP